MRRLHSNLDGQKSYGAMVPLGQDVIDGAWWLQVKLIQADTPLQPQDESAAGKTTTGTFPERSGTRHAVRCHTMSNAANQKNILVPSLCMVYVVLLNLRLCRISNSLQASEDRVDRCGVCSWWTRFWWLLKRSLVAQLRNPTDVTSRLLLSCWIGLLAGTRSCSRTTPASLAGTPLSLRHHNWCTCSRIRSQALPCSIPTATLDAFNTQQGSAMYVLCTHVHIC